MPASWHVFADPVTYIPTALVSGLFCSSIPTSFFILLKYIIQQWVISVEGRRGTYPLLSPACSDFNHNYYNYAELRK